MGVYASAAQNANITTACALIVVEQLWFMICMTHTLKLDRIL